MRSESHKAPALVCKHCDKEPSDHVVRNERLTCPGTNGSGEWEYTDNRLAWEIMQQLDDLEARKIRLTRRLHRVVAAQPKRSRPMRFNPAVEDFVNMVMPTMEGYDQYGELIDPESAQ